VNNLVKSIRVLRTLTPAEFKLAMVLARPDSMKPGRKTKAAKPVVRRRRKAKAEAEATE